MSSAQEANRHGVTLLEMLVVLVILGVVASLAYFAPAAVARPPTDGVEAAIASARREAIRSGQPVTIDVWMDGRIHAATALPDGSVVAEQGIRVERLTGHRRSIRQPAGAP